MSRSAFERSSWAADGLPRVRSSERSWARSAWYSSRRLSRREIMPQRYPLGMPDRLPDGADALAEQLDPGLQLRDGAAGDFRPPAEPAHLGVHLGVRLSCPARVDAHEAVEQSALLGEGAMQGLRLGLLLAALLPILAASRLALLALLEKVVHLLGVEQPRDADEVPLLGAAGCREGAVLLPVEHRLLEGGDRGQRLPFELVGELGRGLLLAVRLVEQRILEQGALGRLAVEGVVAFALQLCAEAQQHGHARQEHRRELTASPRTHEAPDGLSEVERRRCARRVHPDAEPRHID